jgi:homospermidine synthase
VTRHPERVLVLGCGSVAQCVVPLLVRDLGIEPSRLTVVDFVDNRDRIANEISLGVTYEIGRVTPENIDTFLGERVGDGDVLLDLAWNIDNPTILTWCREHGVRYLNTSVEVWDPYVDLVNTKPLDRTLYVRHMELRRMLRAWPDNTGPTAVLEHGANPGMVSHLVKQALLEIGTAMVQDGLGPDALSGALATAATTGTGFNVLAMHTGTKVIHVAERDTQITDQPKRTNEFVNTWSVDGFYEEGIAPAELGWGICFFFTPVLYCSFVCNQPFSCEVILNRSGPVRSQAKRWARASRSSSSIGAPCWRCSACWARRLSAPSGRAR